MKSPPVSVLLQTQSPSPAAATDRPNDMAGRTDDEGAKDCTFFPPTPPTNHRRHFLRILTYYPPQIRLNGENFLLSPPTLHLHKMYPQLSLSRSFVLLAVVFCSVLSCFVARGIIYLSPFWQPSIVHTTSPSTSLMPFLVVLVVFIPVSDHHHHQQQIRNLLSSTFSALPSSVKCNGRHLRLREGLERHEDRCTFE